MFFANDFHPDNAGSIMLGITDEDVEGEWKTFDGEPVPYTNWNTINGEPSGGTSSNYAWVYTKVTERNHGSNLPAGTWNDLLNDDIVNDSSVDYICAYEPTTPTDTRSKYNIVVSIFL